MLVEERFELYGVDRNTSAAGPFLWLPAARSPKQGKGDAKNGEAFIHD
jgi:hypothetical protein